MHSSAKFGANGYLGDFSSTVQAGLLDVNQAGVLTSNFIGSNTAFGVKHELDALSIQASANGGIVNGGGGSARADAIFLKQGGSLYVGNDPKNPALQVGANYGLLNARALVNFSAGNSGRYSGLSMGLGATANTLEAGADGEMNLPIPFTKSNIGLKTGASIKGLGVGAAGALIIANDNLEDRFHVGGSLEGTLGIGGGISFDISFGARK